MDKRQLIESIQALNEQADAKFLSQFNEPDLAEYLQRLQDASKRNISLKSWSRPAKRDYRMVS